MFFLSCKRENNRDHLLSSRQIISNRLNIQYSHQAKENYRKEGIPKLRQRNEREQQNIVDEFSKKKSLHSRLATSLKINSRQY